MNGTAAVLCFAHGCGEGGGVGGLSGEAGGPVRLTLYRWNFVVFGENVCYCCVVDVVVVVSLFCMFSLFGCPYMSPKHRSS